MISEIRKKILLIVAKRGYTGADREVFFHSIRGIRYSDLEKEVQGMENDGYISIEWVGPSNFTVTITPKGVELVKTFGEDVWHKDIKALEVLDKSKHAKKTILTEKVGYSKMMEEKIHVTEVGELSSEIIKGIDEHIMAERGMSEETIEAESVGVPAVEEVIDSEVIHGKEGLVEKRISGEIESTESGVGEEINLSADEWSLEKSKEDRIEADEATSLEKRVKEKRISGDFEGGTPMGEPEKIDLKKAKEPSPSIITETVKTMDPQPPPEIPNEEPPEVPSEAKAEIESSPDFYKQIEDAIAFGESLDEEMITEEKTESLDIYCQWEAGLKCQMVTDGKVKTMKDLDLNHCIMCQILEIKRLLNR